jgi:peroxiredoxin
MRVPISNQKAPPWEMAKLDGEMASSEEFAGKIQVVNFWATWCPPCVRELPELQAFHEENKEKGVVVIGASTDTDGSDLVKRFATRNGLTFPILMADETAQQVFGGISQIPTTFIVDRDGTFVARYIGALTKAELNKVVAPLLAKPAPPVIPRPADTPAAPVPAPESESVTP